jgi:hypothetical protein
MPAARDARSNIQGLKTALAELRLVPEATATTVRIRTSIPVDLSWQNDVRRVDVKHNIYGGQSTTLNGPPAALASLLEKTLERETEIYAKRKRAEETSVDAYRALV